MFIAATAAASTTTVTISAPPHLRTSSFPAMEMWYILLLYWIKGSFFYDVGPRHALSSTILSHSSCTTYRLLTWNGTEPCVHCIMALWSWTDLPWFLPYARLLGCTFGRVKINTAGKRIAERPAIKRRSYVTGKFVTSTVKRCIYDDDDDDDDVHRKHIFMYVCRWFSYVSLRLFLCNWNRRGGGLGKGLKRINSTELLLLRLRLWIKDHLKRIAKCQCR